MSVEVSGASANSVLPKLRIKREMVLMDLSFGSGKKAHCSSPFKPETLAAHRSAVYESSAAAKEVQKAGGCCAASDIPGCASWPPPRRPRGPAEKDSPKSSRSGGLLLPRLSVAHAHSIVSLPSREGFGWEMP
eukprot:RCo049072